MKKITVVVVSFVVALFLTVMLAGAGMACSYYLYGRVEFSRGQVARSQTYDSLPARLYELGSSYLIDLTWRDEMSQSALVGGRDQRTTKALFEATFESPFTLHVVDGTTFHAEVRPKPGGNLNFESVAIANYLTYSNGYTQPVLTIARFTAQQVQDGTAIVDVPVDPAVFQLNYDGFYTQFVYQDENGGSLNFDTMVLHTIGPFEDDAGNRYAIVNCQLQPLGGTNSSVPEPASAALLAVGGLAVLGWLRLKA